MNRRLFLPLLICGLLLAGCYRQSTDSFEQVDSQSLQSIASPTVATLEPIETQTVDDSSAQNQNETQTTSTSLAPPSKTLDPADVDPTDIVLATATPGIPATSEAPIVPTATEPVFVTPEPPPGQVEQPTLAPLPTATPTFDIIQASPTNVGDGPQAGDECIHVVVSGDNLFRIAVNNGTTVEAIQELNSLEGDAIQIEQLLRIPGCVPGQPDEPDETATQTTIRPTSTSAVGGSTIATLEPADNLPTAGQQIHVVVSGETLGAIANRYNTTVAAIVELNSLTDPNALSVGQELVIPASN